MNSRRLAVVVLAIATLCGFGDAAEVPEPPIRSVRAATVAEISAVQRQSHSGTIEAQTEVALTLRIGTQMVERAVDVGVVVAAGQLVARLDAADEENALRAARAALAAADSQL